MRKVCYIIIALIFQYSFAQSGVGIGTTNPLQKLHIGSPAGTMRIESLNHLNNPFNGGDTDNDGNLADEKFPLFVDENGEFTLEFRPLINSADLDAFNNAVLPNSSVTLPSNDVDGTISTIIDTYSITVARPSVLELKYNISYDVYYDSNLNKIIDGLARRIETYVTVTGQTRKYGHASKCYSSSTPYSVTGTFYNGCTTYITFPSAGTYEINFHGAVASDLTSANNGAPSRAAYVEFATGNDFLFARLH